MRAQRSWVAVVARETYEAERLYANVLLDIDRATSAEIALGDSVALVSAGEPPLLFGLGVVTASGLDGRGGPAPGLTLALAVRYTHRLFDEPQPIDAQIAAAVGIGFGDVSPSRELSQGVDLTAVGADDFGRLTAGVGPEHRADRDRSEWFVTVALPIEASSPAEAVREFWSYVDKLGPRELPAFVWPRGDELAMQAYVLGEATNLDPEEDDDG